MKKKKFPKNKKIPKLKKFSIKEIIPYKWIDPGLNKNEIRNSNLKLKSGIQK